MNAMNQLIGLRSSGGAMRTRGLSDEVIRRFADRDPTLSQAVSDAVAAHARLQAEFPDLMAADENEQIHALLGGLVNFYADDQVNPYVALAARGPWIITSKGAVLHDNGGYGMLGFGHAIFTIFHVTALYSSAPYLLITIPLHLIYTAAA